MEEARVPAQARLLRTRSALAATATERQRPVNATGNIVSATNNDTTSSAAAPTLKGEVLKEESVDDNDEVATLRFLLQEREEQVTLLEGLLSEKQLLLRRDEILEERLQQYEEQLGKLASIVRVDAPGTSALKKGASSSKKEKEGNVISSSGTSKKQTPSIHEIMDGVQKLRYDKQRMEIDLVRKERTLGTLQSQLKKLQEETKGGELPVKNNPTRAVADLVFDTSKPAEEVEMETAEERKSRFDLEKKLLEMQKRQTRTEEKLSCYQKEYYAARQSLRLREKELLEFQRKHRDSAASIHGKQDQLIVSQSWKDSEKMKSTQYRHFFRGSEWVQLVEKRPEAMRTSILKDVSLTLSAPYGFVSISELNQGPDMVVILELVVQHPTSLLSKQVELLLMDCPFNGVKELLKHRNDPKDGWDLVQEQLHETRNNLMKKEEEMLVLQQKLHRLESSLEEEIKQRDTDDLLIQQALDETEETLKAMYAEIEKQRVKEEELHSQYQKIKETLEEREKTIKEVTLQLQKSNDEMKKQKEVYVKQLEEVKRKTSEEIRNVETKRREKVQSVLQQQEQLIVKTKEKTSILSYTLVVKWDEKGEKTPLSLDSKNKEILGTLVLGDITTALTTLVSPTTTKVIPSKLLSLICTGCEIQAEVQLNLYTTTEEDAGRVVEHIRRCRTSSAVLFLQEWRDMKHLMEIRNREIQRLAKELKISTDEAEKFKSQLQIQCEKTQMTEESHTIALKELSHVRTALGVNDGGVESSAGIATAVGNLVKRIAEVEKARQQEKQQWHQQEQQHGEQKEEYQREQEELRELLRKSKYDMENTTAALNTLRATHQSLVQECAVREKARDVVRSQFTELQKSRPVNTSNDTETIDKEDDDDNNVESVILSRLRSSYIAYDKMLEKQEIAMKQWLVMETSLQDKLQNREREFSQLQLRCTKLEKELEKKTIADAASIANYEESDAKYRDLINSFKAENEALSARVEKLNQQCATLESDRNKLKSEMACRSERAEELMKQLVQEEDTRRELEKEVIKLRRTKTAISTSSTRTTVFEVKRLRNFCLHTLKIPLTEKQQGVGDIVASMEQHYSGVLEEKEQLAAALLSMHTAVRLLKQCVSTTEEHKENPIRRTRSSAGNKTIGTGSTPVSTTTVHNNNNNNHHHHHNNHILRGFGRSVSYSSGLAPPLLSARASRSIGRKSATTPSLARMASSQYHLQPSSQQQQKEKEEKEKETGKETPRKQETLSAKPLELASSAAEAVYFAQLLVSVVNYWRENERQHSTRLEDVSRKCQELSEKLTCAEHALIEQQQRENEKEEQMKSMMEFISPREEEQESFLRRSRAHALCVMLSVKDHLHDALAAMQPVVAVMRDDAVITTNNNSNNNTSSTVNTSTRGRFTTNITHGVRMTEESVVYALKRIVNAAGTLFSPRERSDIEIKRGAEYFTIPEAWRGTASPRTPLQLTPLRITQQQQIQKGLVPRDANSSPLSPTEKQRSGSHDAVSVSAVGTTGSACVDYRQYMSRDDQQVIQQALREARRRRR
ncbi:hypothetical protein LSM04_000046 [Trypanosoma melophagium]|uniref:uncharacterized protein n=1 Tax=Trypanosoma melophagium TaxID=715481 RepID=UPI00351A2F57|nr:hypothetical protein LSM04_000046 [Trypanosoma melophagium]